MPRTQVRQQYHQVHRTTRKIDGEAIRRRHPLSQLETVLFFLQFLEAWVNTERDFHLYIQTVTITMRDPNTLNITCGVHPHPRGSYHITLIILHHRQTTTLGAQLIRAQTETQDIR